MLIAKTSGVGSAITAASVTVQPMLSVTVTVYVPAGKELTGVPTVLLASSQSRISGAVPPDAEALTEPSDAPLQFASFALAVTNTGDGAAIAMLSVIVQLFASVAITV